MYLIASTIVNLVNLYCIIIFLWAILSWFQNNKTARKFQKMLDVVVAPYVNLFKKIIPPMGGMDFTPFIAMVVLQLVARLLFGLLT